MPLRECDNRNFSTLMRAARDGNLALVECKDAKTGEYRAVIAAISFDGEYHITPFGHLATGNPFEDYIDPTTSQEMDEGHGNNDS